MSKYRIVLDGKTYEMEVDLISDSGMLQPTVKKEVEMKNINTPASFAAASTVQNPTVNSAGTVVAPMPGTVIRTQKRVGDTVKSGELVLVLEAMKMENEILAPMDGTIVVMNCAEGSTVAGGEVLFEIK